MVYSDRIKSPAIMANPMIADGYRANSLSVSRSALIGP
jgi:hypothetical protein